MLQQLWLSGAAAGAGVGRVSQLLKATPSLSHLADVLLQQVRQSSSSSPAAAAAAAAASSNSRKHPEQTRPQQSSKEAAAAEAAAAGKAASAAAALASLAAQYQRSRLQEFYTQHLARELLLKLNLDNSHQLPRVKSVDLSMNAKDTHGRRYAEKHEMLLPALALEYITGKPATFVVSTLKYYRSRNAITAVKVHLEGSEALDLLQKLVYLVLPSQNAFAGISSKALDRGGNLHFRVQKIINFPDFEEQFEIFESLGALHVSVNMANTAGKRGRSQLLMSGLQIPMLQKKGAADAEAAAAAAGAAAESTGSDSDVGTDGYLGAADD